MNEKNRISIGEILNRTDHTLLDRTSNFGDIFRTCEESIEFSTASVCIPPCFVNFARNQFGKNLKICTVIGFPNGNSSLEVKFFETENALSNGADEIDMVINVSFLKCEMYEEILQEISKIRQICDGKILKVIIECCLLSDIEKIKMCGIIGSAGADFIKTSTGFSSGGATVSDVKLLKNNIKNNLKIKAAGGINSIEDAKKLIVAGADRLGSSRIVNLVKNLNYANSTG